MPARSRERIRGTEGGYRRDHLRSLAQRVEVADDAIRIMGSKTELLRTLIAGQVRASAAAGVPRGVPKWRRERSRWTNPLLVVPRELAKLSEIGRKPLDDILPSGVTRRHPFA
jgi:hypothetical protein